MAFAGTLARWAQIARRDETLVTDVGMAAGAAALLVAVFAAMIAEPAVPRTVTPAAAIGSVTHRLNDVRRRLDGTLVWRPLESGATVYERDALYVAAGSDAQIQLVDGGRLDLDPSSLVIISRGAASSRAPELAVEVRRGSAAGSAGDEALTLVLGGARASLAAGAQARVAVHGPEAQLEVARGRALIRAGAAEQDIGAAERSSIDSEGRLSERETLGVRLVTPVEGARVLTAGSTADVELAWEPLAGDAAYRVELAPEPGFAAVLLARPCATPRVKVPSLAPGIYYWRVRSRAADGEHTSEARKLVVLRDEPPLLMRPRSGEVVDLSGGAPLALGWREVEGARGYDVELDGEAGAQAIVRESRRPSLLLALSELGSGEGRYCVRVRAHRHDGAGVWSERVCFRVALTPVLRAPELYDPKREPAPERPAEHGWRFDPWLLVGGVAHAAEPGAAIVLRWEKIPGAAAYLLEIAADAGFSRALVSERVSESWFRWRPPDSAGNYYWRVRAVDASGHEGQQSEVRHLSASTSADEGGSPSAPIEPASPVKPPKLLTPSPGERLSWSSGTRVPLELEWSGSPSASYQVQLATEPSFALLLWSGKARGTRVSTEVGAAGIYYWRVRQSGAAGKWSATSSFEVLPHETPSQETPKRALRAGPRVGFFHDLDVVQTMRLGADGIWAPAWSGAFALNGRVAYYTTSNTSSLGIDERLHAFPVDVVLLCVLPWRSVRLLAGVGGTASFVWAITSSERSRRQLELGGLALVAMEQDAGPGAAFVELALGGATHTQGIVADDPGGVLLSVGYRIGVR